MASSIPSQTRAVDPFASFNSETVNKLTEVLSHGQDGLVDYNSLQVAIDTTSSATQVVVSTGNIIKDDVFITISAQHTVDFTDSDHYVSFAGGFNEAGVYYIVLDYTYVKSRPAPQARIKILKPSQLPNVSVGTSLFFLKAVTVIYNGSSFEISSVDDHDPSDLTVKREYTPLYFGVEDQLPTHVSTRDQGRIVYVSSTDSFYFGRANSWINFSSAAGNVSVTSIATDTTGLWAGALTYVDTNGDAQLSIATSVNYKAELGVVTIGSVASDLAESIVVGILENVRIESGYSIIPGDLLYLSASEAGKVTPSRPVTNIQEVGVALTSGNDSNPIDMIFLPRAMFTTALFGVVQTTDWVSDSGSYRYDIDISSLDASTHVIITSFFADNAGTMELIQPTNIQMLDTGGAGYDVLRVWMTVNTLDVYYNLSIGTGTPSDGGGGGGGVNDHALLLNLDYASSGHTGFLSTTPHSNAYHSDPPSIPSGEEILFRSDTAVANYTLVTSIDDHLVYITKGSAAGGETGGTTKTSSTWTQPNHTHSITSEADHSHTGGSHALAEAEIPNHTHTVNIESQQASDAHTDTTLASASYSGTISSTFATGGTGGGTAHSHGATSDDGAHDHGGATGGDATANTWRPSGTNFTIQQKV